MLTNMIYNLTDTFFIGMMNNTSMTAAVGIVFSLVSLVQAVGFWFGYGSGNAMSRRLGEGNEGEAAVYASTGVVLSLVVGVLVTVTLLPRVQTLAMLIGGNASDQVLVCTTSYLRIILLSVPFSLFALTVYNQLNRQRMFYRSFWLYGSYIGIGHTLIVVVVDERVSMACL